MGITKERSRATEICKNLKLTINKFKKLKTTVASRSTAFESTRASKSKLTKLRDNVIKKFKLTEKELQG